jgi:hypothetical protein
VVNTRSTPITTRSMLPNLIVIGGMKCGTSSLHYYLSLHPEIFMSKTKELSFFSDYWDRGVGWYQQHFPEESPVRGESSPNYTKHPAFPGVPERMASVVPHAKLVYVVRDPIKRIISHYIDSFSWKRENRNLDDALAVLEGNHYVNVSRYAMQLERYLEHYPIERVLVVAAEDLRDRRDETLWKVFEFLRVNPAFSSPDFERVLNTTFDRRRRNALGEVLTRGAGRLDPAALAVTLHSRTLKPVVDAYVSVTSRPVARGVLSDERRRELAAFLRDDVGRLRELTGREFAEWSV